MAQETNTAPKHWPLRIAKGRLSEMVRRVDCDGPQHITIRGRDTAVMMSAAEARRLTGRISGHALIEALQTSPSPELKIEPDSFPMRVHPIAL